LKILFDHNLPKRYRQKLPGHEIKTAREMGWEALANGLLLRAAASAGFEAVISADKNLEFQQNLSTLPLPVLVLAVPANTVAALEPTVNIVLDLLKAPLDRALYLIEPNGAVRRFVGPRP